MPQGYASPRMLHLLCKTEYKCPPHPWVLYSKHRADFETTIMQTLTLNHPEKRERGLWALKMKHAEWFHWVGDESLSKPSFHASVLHFPNCIAQGHCLQVIPQETHLPGNEYLCHFEPLRFLLWHQRWLCFYITVISFHYKCGSCLL